MTSSNQSGNSRPYITPVGLNLVDPIVTLVECLDSFPQKGANEVQTSPVENGYASAVILLATCLLEAALNKIKYVDSKLDGEENAKGCRNALKFFRLRFPDPKPSDLHQKATEIFVVRDVIAHSHIWEATLIDNEEEFRLLAAQLTKGYGDDKYTEVVDIATRKTRLLQLNVFPTKINSLDALVVLKAALEIFRFIEEEGKTSSRDYPCVVNRYVKFKDAYPSFGDLVDKLKWEP